MFEVVEINVNTSVFNEPEVGVYPEAFCVLIAEFKVTLATPALGVVTITEIVCPGLMLEALICVEPEGNDSVK